MKPVLAVAVVVVQLALIAYTVAVVLLQRRRRASPGVVGFLTAGVAFDVAATTCMILGTERGAFTLHGILGYTALAAMLVDTVLVRRHRRRFGEASVPRPLHLYSRAAYAWWVVAYVTGAALVAMSRAAG